MRNSYDFIICGGGLSGSLLAYYLLESGLPFQKILIIDPALYNRPPRLWSYWSCETYRFERYVDHYNHWRYLKTGIAREHALGFSKNRFRLMHSKDFYEFMDRYLDESEKVERVAATVTEMGELDGHAYVRLYNTVITGNYVFDSTSPVSSYTHSTADRPMYMQGLTTRIRFNKPVLKPNTITLFDFYASPLDEFLFYYVLPLTSRSAYIESAHFTQEPVSYSYDWYTNQFADYLKVRFPAVSYELQEAHIGKIPLNSHTFSRLVSPHVVRIGAAAGLVKSGTGYGFTRIVEDTLQLVNSLCIYNNPLHTGHPSRMYHLLDECLLHSMTDKPYKVKRLFSDLFTHSTDGDILLDFLNEKLGFKDAYSLLTQLDPRPIIPSVVPTVFKIY